MCGIGAVFGGGDLARRARAVAEALAHRGPDDQGIEIVGDESGTPQGALAHRRLAIIDLSAAGHQPMASGDGRWSVVFNGEIYNYVALRDELLAEGATLRGHSDTEVIVEGVARHGVDFARRLRGMYAIVLWDRRERRAHLLRDAFGIKPMYVAERDGSVVIASELRAVLAAGSVPRELAPEAVRAFLAWGSVPEPLTMIRGVRMLPAGSHAVIRVRDGRASVGEAAPLTTMWDRDATASPCTDRDEALARVRAALEDSVRHHMVSDVPVALFLSGGIDSSAVVALAASAAGRQLSTFTITFGERAFDESRYARAVAERYATQHHDIRLTGDDLLRELPAALAAMDQPSMDGLNTYAVSKAVRDHGLKVVLSGLGGDELFAGYPAFARARRAAAVHSTPRAVRRLGGHVARRLGGNAGKLGLLLDAEDAASGAYSASRALFAGAQLSALAGRGAVDGPATPEGLSPLQGVSWHELTGYMRNTLLRDSDVFSMAHALELRVPFVDRVVASAALSVDDALKLVPGRAKPLLVDAVRDLIPTEVWDRPKQGFALPFDHWMRGVLHGEVADALSSRERTARVGIPVREAERVWRGFLAGRSGLSWSRPWALFVLTRWAEAVGAERFDAADLSAPHEALVPA